MPEVGLSPEREEKLARARLQWYRAVGIMSVITLGLVAYVVLDTQTDNKQAQQAREALLSQSELLVECTTRPDLRKPPAKDVSPKVPGLQVGADDCYSRQQTAQGDIVGEPEGPLNTVAVAAAACGAAHPGDFAATFKCTTEALEEQG